MSPIAAITTCFRKYVDFSGRAKRPEFWWFALFMVLAHVLLALIDISVFPIAMRSTPPVFYPLTEAFALATLLPSFAVTARRIQDTGSTALTAMLLFGFATVLGYVFTIMDAFAFYRYEDSAFLVTLSFVALAAVIALLIIAAKRSDPNDNAWGPAPAPAPEPALS